jgi:hypothetical protein
VLINRYLFYFGVFVNPKRSGFFVYFVYSFAIQKDWM